MVDSLTHEDVTRWLSTVTSTNTKCWAENPETVKESGFMTTKTFTTYRILLKASDGELIACRHRFSDFDTLRDNLRAKFFTYGLLVPALPPKKLTGTQDREFLTERMQGLSLLCEELVAFPWFRKDPIWLEFMGSGSASRDRSHSAADAPAPEDILTFMCNQLPLPYLPLERLVEVKEETVGWEKKVKAVLDNLKSVQAATKQLQAATTSLHTSLDALHCASSPSDPSSATPSSTSSPKYLTGGAEEMTKGNWGLRLRPCEELSTVTGALSTLVKDKVQAKAHSAEYLNILFHSFLEREVARCSALRELLKYQDDLCSSIEALTVSIEKFETKKVQTEKIKWQLRDAKTELEEKKLLLNTFYKGFFYFTLPLSVKGRSENLRRMADCVAAYELVEGTNQQQAAATLLSTMNASAVQVVTDTRSMLDLLSLCPLGSLQHEEELLSELGILPGMSIKAGHDWLVEIYRAYTGGDSEEQEEQEDELEYDEDILSTAQRQFSPAASPTKHASAMMQEEEQEQQKEEEEEVSTAVDLQAVTLEPSQQEQQQEEQEQRESPKTEPPPSSSASSDSLAFLTSSATEQQRKEEAERNRSTLFGD
mmetsp:Transcript_2291/g.4235  ORF Transcript_2291/g.4235 Transcript_2291/m.4235 type:complete len:596 (+) Transcript_2291:212-1999(+)